MEKERLLTSKAMTPKELRLLKTLIQYQVKPGNDQVKTLTKEIRLLRKSIEKLSEKLNSQGQ